VGQRERLPLRPERHDQLAVPLGDGQRTVVGVGVGAGVRR
jgi:hypothetical protein